MSGSKCGLVMIVTACPRRRRANPSPTKGWTSPALPTGMSRTFKRAFLQERLRRAAEFISAGVNPAARQSWKQSDHQLLDRCAPGDQMERPIEAIAQFQVGGDAE